MSRPPLGPALLGLVLAAAPAPADILHIDDVIVDGNLCVGAGCSDGETFVTEPMKLKTSNLRLRFVDTSTSPGFPAGDWEIEVNDTISGGLNRFSVADLSASRTPFTIEGGAPDNALWVSKFGFVGIGTSLPVDDLHIMRSTPSVRLDHVGTYGQAWRLAVDDFGFYIQDDTSHLPALRIEPGASATAPGRIGMGTLTPAAALHLRRSDATAAMLIEEATATVNPRTLLNLTNNGRPEIVMANTATNGEWSFGAGTDFFLKTGPIGSPSGAKTRALTVKANGDAFLRGTLTTGGTTCGGGCDRVFTDHQIIPAPDYAAQMWAQGHLPHVGPTVEGAPLNVSGKLGGILNALEHAHVFIDAQRVENEAQRAEISKLRGALAIVESGKAAQDARIARLEARLAALTGEN